MKKHPLAIYLYGFLIIILLNSSCSSTKQAFYFNPAPVTLKVATHKTPDPVYLASTDLTNATIPVTKAIELPAQKEPVTTISKKELRKLMQQSLKSLKDSSEQKNGNKRVSATVKKEKLAQLENEIKEIKKSVRVQEDGKKAVVSVKRPSTTLNQTELILLGIGALLVLIILLSLPVIGTLLGLVLALGIIALGLGLLLGYIEIDGF